MNRQTIRRVLAYIRPRFPLALLSLVLNLLTVGRLTFRSWRTCC